MQKPDWHGNLNEVIMRQLSVLERQLVKRLDLIMIRGKRDRNVAAILIPEVKRALNLLVDCRDRVGINKENMYLFPRSTGTDHIEGHVSLRNLTAEILELEYPERICSTSIRKFTATIVQMLNLNSGEIEWLSNHLGHTVDVHKEYYRNHESAVEMGKIASMLLRLDRSTNIENASDSESDCEDNIIDVLNEQIGHKTSKYVPMDGDNSSSASIFPSTDKGIPISVHQSCTDHDSPIEPSVSVAKTIKYPPKQKAEGSALLPEGVTHYVIPDPQTARKYLEIFENPHIQGIIFTQTAVHSIQHDGSRRLYNRLKAVVKDRKKGSVIFHNEFQTYAHCEREPGEKQAQWHIRATYKTAEWYFNHLAGSIPVVMVTDNDQFVYDFGHKTQNLFVVKLRDYLDGFWSEIIPGITDLYTSLQEVSLNKTKDTDYIGYLPLEILSKGIKSGKYQQGFLQVNKSNASQEAFIRRTKVDLTEDSSSDILIPGMAARNRAVHGDLVVVEILPKSQWQNRSNTISDPASEEKGDGDKAVKMSDKTDAMPTGKVVGVLQRNWREYVACFSQDEETGRGDKKAGKVLVIPWDYRIPKIRISTRQVDALRDHRMTVKKANICPFDVSLKDKFQKIVASGRKQPQGEDEQPEADETEHVIDDVEMEMGEIDEPESLAMAPAKHQKKSKGMEYAAQEKQELEELIKKRKHEQLVRDGHTVINQAPEEADTAEDTKKTVLGIKKPRRPYDRKPVIDFGISPSNKASSSVAVETTSGSQLPGNKFNSFSATRIPESSSGNARTGADTITDKFAGAKEKPKSSFTGESKHSFKMQYKNQSSPRTYGESSVVNTRDVHKLVGQANAEQNNKFYLSRKKQREETSSLVRNMDRGMSDKISNQQTVLPTQTWEFYKDFKGKVPFKLKSVEKPLSKSSSDTNEQEKVQRPDSIGAEHVKLAETDCRTGSCMEKERAEKYLNALGSGWKKDWTGSWIKDEDAEFDSDEEPPDI